MRRVGVSLSIEVVDPLFPPPCEADREPPPPSSEMEPPNSPEARACRLVKDLRENCMAPSVGHRVPGAGLTSQTSRSACESRNQYMPGVSTDLCPPRAQRSGLDGGGPIAPTPSPPSGPRVISWRDPSRPVRCPVQALPMFRDILPREGRMTMASILWSNVYATPKSMAGLVGSKRHRTAADAGTKPCRCWIMTGPL